MAFTIEWTKDVDPAVLVFGTIGAVLFAGAVLALGYRIFGPRD